MIIWNTAAVVLLLLFEIFKSFIQEKGKNLATKKDIQEITTKIETVKSEVGILTHKKINLSDEKQKTLIDLTIKYSIWLKFIMQTEISDYPTCSENYYNLITKMLNDLYFDYLAEQAKVDIYFNSDFEIIEMKDELEVKTIDLSNHFKENLNYARVELKCINLIEKNSANEYYKTEMKKHTDILIELTKSYQEIKLQKYKDIALIYFKLSQKVSERIHAFEKE